MDPLTNPYTPNAGAAPPLLVGRDDQLSSFELLLARLEAGRVNQSMIITGLRGVGKTVLLNAFRQKGEDRGWAVVDIEVSKHTDAEFRQQLTFQVRRALFTFSPRKRWGERVKAAAGVLRSFSLSFDPMGSFTAGFDIEPWEGRADSGNLEFDLSDLLVAVGEAARESGKGLLILLDEIQFLSRDQLEAFVMALHKCVQRNLPVTVVGGGLPQIAELAGEAKSYSERLFTFPVIGSLDEGDAASALTDPARKEGAVFEPEAVALAQELTSGYPFFIQELGYAIWPLADDDRVTADDVREARLVYIAKLDSSFFRVRLDRTTDLERAYLRAMAELGPDPQQAAAVAPLLNRTSEQCGPARSTLIEKGLLYTPSHGYAAFTVPHFDRYMRRAVPELVVPPLRARRRRGKGE